MRGSNGVYDFNSLRPHVSRCLLRQICKRIVNSPSDAPGGVPENVPRDDEACDEDDEYISKIMLAGKHHIQRFYGALIFVDISGFTSLSTRLDIESLTRQINDYFKEMLAIIENFGGDVVKFAGDAMYVVWHATTSLDREIAVYRAVACGKEIVRKCNNRSVSLSPTTRISSTAETMFKRISLTQSLLSGHCALERESDYEFESTDDEDTGAAGFLGGIDDDDNPQFSPRSPRQFSAQSRGSVTSKIRRRSMPGLFTSGKALNNGISYSTECGETSLNVHIGISVGILAGIDVGARGKSEFFMTGQPLLDVTAAESLAKLGEIVVSKSVHNLLIRNNQNNNGTDRYECVNAELGCYRIEAPIVLSLDEEDLQGDHSWDLKKELQFMLHISNWGEPGESTQRAALLKSLSTHVHEAARMQSPIQSRANSPKPFDMNDCQSTSIDNVSCSSSTYSSADSLENSAGMREVTVMNTSFEQFGSINEGNDVTVTNSMGVSGPVSSNKFERMDSFCNREVPDESLSAELRELVVLFIKIEIDVSLSHLKQNDAEVGPLRRIFCDEPEDNFQFDSFGFLERSPEDEAADVALYLRFQSCMTILADTFSDYGGQIGQYSCGDKGNVCLATFGLRGSVQEDNAAAAIESAQTIIVRLQAIGLNASIGVASGKVYGGLVGSPARHEYSIMGPAANLSARLMCAATVGTILCDNVTRNRDRSHLFLDMPMVNAKGYATPVATYQPILSESGRRRLSSRRSSKDSTSESNRYERKYSGIFDENVSEVSQKGSLQPLMSPTPNSCFYGRDEELSIVINFLKPKLQGNQNNIYDDNHADSYYGSGTEKKETVDENFDICDGQLGNNKKSENKSGNETKNDNSVKIAIVTGACGCGKTAFLAAARDKISKESLTDVLILSGGSNSYDTTVPFNSWRPVLAALFVAVSQNRRDLECADPKSPQTESPVRAKAERRRGVSSPKESSPPRDRAGSGDGIILGSDRTGSGFGTRDIIRDVAEEARRELEREGEGEGEAMSSSGDTREGWMTSEESTVPSPSSAGGSRKSSGNSQSTADDVPQRFNHLRAGVSLITVALAPSDLAHLPLVFKLLPSFAKAVKNIGLKTADSALAGTAKLSKTVEILSILIQTAVSLLGGRNVFITLDDIQSMDPSSWNLLIYIWRHNKSISVLASFHSLSRSSARGKVNIEDSEVTFSDFDENERCKVMSLAPLDKPALSQLVARMLRSSRLSDSQVALIGEAAIDLAGGNPLFAREITISAMETFTDILDPNIDALLSSDVSPNIRILVFIDNSSSMEDSTLSQVMNTLRPRRRIEEIISLRFDRLTPTYQLVLKIASVIGKDGASFTADIISHIIKELSINSTERNNNASGSSKSSKYPPKNSHLTQLRTKGDSSSTIANLNSVNVEETLKKILGLNEFIKVVERSSRMFYSPINQPVGVLKYKFKNILVKKCIYSLMLNHQKIWSHQKVAEYLEKQALVKVSELPYGLGSYGTDDDSDVCDDGSNEGENDSRNIIRNFRSIADWNMLGVHWRLSNNLIKAMACFYESGYLVDHQGDVETSKLLWTEAYQILCLMRKESSFIRDLPSAIHSIHREVHDDLNSAEDGGACFNNPHTTMNNKNDDDNNNSNSNDSNDNTNSSSLDDPGNINGANWVDGTPILSPRRLSLGSVGSKDENALCCETPHYLSECVYHVFKGDSLALELAITLIIRLSQNIMMFQQQPEDVANLSNEALELVSCTRRAVLEHDSVNFIHVPRLSPSLFLRGSSLLGPQRGKKERRQSITLKNGKKLFCLRDPSIIFPVLSGLCMRYSGKLLPDDEIYSNWDHICTVYLTTARDSKIPVHIIRALTLKSLLHFVRNEHEMSIKQVEEMDTIYVYLNHSELLIHIYGADRATMQYSFAAMSCVLLGDFKRAIINYQRAETYLSYLNHLQSIVVTTTMQFIVYHFLHMYDTAHDCYAVFLEFLNVSNGHQNIFYQYIPLFAELGRRLATAHTPRVSAPSSPFLPSHSRHNGSNNNNNNYYNYNNYNKITNGNNYLNSNDTYTTDNKQNNVKHDNIFSSSDVYNIENKINNKQHSFFNSSDSYNNDNKNSTNYNIKSNNNSNKNNYFDSVNNSSHGNDNSNNNSDNSRNSRDNNDTNNNADDNSNNSNNSNDGNDNNDNNSNNSNNSNKDETPIRRVSQLTDIMTEKEEPPQDESKYSSEYDYGKLIEESYSSVPIEYSKNIILVLLALRYGKGVELMKAELCLLEAKRIHSENVDKYFNMHQRRYSCSSPFHSNCTQVTYETNGTTHGTYASMYTEDCYSTDSENRSPIWRFNGSIDSESSDTLLGENILEARGEHYCDSVGEAEENRDEIGNEGGNKAGNKGGNEEDNVEIQEGTGRETEESNEGKNDEDDALRQAEEYCEAGIRFIGYSFQNYPVYDSAQNSLQCYLIKAELLVFLSKIQDERNGIRHDKILKYKPSSTELRKFAEQCLRDALELGRTFNIRFPLLLVGMRYVELNLDIKKGRELLTEFFLDIINRDKSPENAVLDVNIAINSEDDEYEWMESIPIIVTAKSLLYI